MKHLSTDGETVTIKIMPTLNPPSRKREKGDKLAILLDVETTGLSFAQDRVIQLAIRPFYFDPETFEITGIARKTVMFNDPQEEIREEIIKITGITNKDVEGQFIDWEWVKNAIERAEFIISHNAKFDRQFVEAEIERANLVHTEGPVWCCSINFVNWNDLFPVKIPSKSLEVLCAWSGFFYDSHSADADIDALLHLLRKHDAMQELITRAGSPEYRVYAVDSPIQQNQLLKRRWYRWDPNVSMWYKLFETREEAEEDVNWLKENIEQVKPEIFELDPKYRYSPE